MLDAALAFQFLISKSSFHCLIHGESFLKYLQLIVKWLHSLNPVGLVQFVIIQIFVAFQVCSN